MALTYRQATGMVRYLRGRATSWKCRGGCGRMGSEWTFVNHSNTGYPVKVGNRTRWVSEDPLDYVPLCKACRRAWVKARAMGAKRLLRVNNSVGRPRPPKTHCPRGHEFTEATTYINPSRPGVRHCRTCRTLHEQKRRARGRFAILNADGTTTRTNSVAKADPRG